ncbi:hypothetical protein FPZ12_033405 [Amycolatopsis acidicola]|uniref:Uncharacterized protein n=2 Tax=Amycolatopsis acidicola TaxID=2596893 RepID=A0A5N0UR51_9PSEU|nr:hypothetical protein FPZ12_033405 [Amycolatopsis acidicola]
MLTAAPAASAAPAAPKSKVAVHAKAEKDSVHVGEKVKITGDLDASSQNRVDSLEPVIVQSLQAGVWVNLSTGSCRPNGLFSIDLSFTVSAQLSLRVFHPETGLYASATSSVFGLLVL